MYKIAASRSCVLSSMDVIRGAPLLYHNDTYVTHDMCLASCGGGGGVCLTCVAPLDRVTLHL